MKPPVFVVNPMSGGGKGERIWSDLCSRHPELEQQQAIVEPDADAAMASLDRWLTTGIDRVVAVGGDGTAHLAVNRILEAGRQEEVAFGLIPAGTGSDLARTLGLPSSPDDALARALGNSHRQVDIIEVTPDRGRKRFVVNVLSLGLSGVAVEMLNRLEKKSSASYIRGALAAIRTYRPAACRIHVDGEPFYEGDILLLAVANGRAFGKGMKIAPEALVDDGLLDIVAIRPAPFWSLILQFPRIFLGTILTSRIVTWRRAREVHFELGGELPRFDLDGEDVSSESFVARILPGALKVLA